jgi:tRNA U34 5-carboxymethylaminomethyl modifying GTPase MnmE/TrmE
MAFLFLPAVSSIPWRQGRRIVLQSSSSSISRLQGIVSSRRSLSFSTTAAVAADVVNGATAAVESALSSAVGIDQSIFADDRTIPPPREEPAAANTTNSNSKAKGNNYNNKFNNKKSNKNKRLTVCILGPPNAGKSTLFNRLIKKDALYRLNTSNTSTLGHRHIKTLGRAIVHNTAGTTRDRRLASAQLAGLEFDVWDTAGILNIKTNIGSISQGGGQNYSNGPKTKHYGRRDEPHNNVVVDTDTTDRLLSQSMLEHAKRAAAASDVVILMFDARYAGLTSDVLDASKWLRKMLYQDQSIHRLLFVANKLEGDAWNYDGSPILETVRDAERRLGGEIIPISAIQGEGLSDLATIFHDVSRELYGDTTTPTPAPTSQSTPKQLDQDQGAEASAAAAATPRKHPLRLAILVSTHTLCSNHCFVLRSNTPSFHHLSLPLLY